MASEGGGKMNAKRGADTGKPYDRRQSIIGRMTSSVKDMLAPSWLKDLVDSVKKKSPTPSAEQTSHPVRHDPSTASRQFESTGGAAVGMPQSPVLHHAPSHLDGASMRDMRTPQFQQAMTSTPAQHQPPAFSSQHLPFTQMDRINNSSLMVNGGEHQSNMNEFSMSAASMSVGANSDHSKLLQQQQQQQQFRPDMSISESRIAQLRQDLGGSVTPSRELEARSSECGSQSSEQSFLWSSEMKQADGRHVLHSHRPSFNISAFGTPGKSKERSSVFGSDYTLSPYYPGKTTFGGAAAQNTVKFKASPNQMAPSRKQVKAQPLNSDRGSGITSSTAKRILDTLDRMSSPVNDAKKIPRLNSNLLDSPLSFTPKSYSRSERRRDIPTPISSHQRNSQGPPVHGLRMPSMAAIAKNVHQPPAPLAQSGEGSLPQAQQASAGQGAVSSQQSTRISGGSAVGSGSGRPGKMKREKAHHYSAKHLEEEEEAEIPDLPTDFVLPMTSMPQFSLGLATASSGATSPPPVSPPASFKFSSPITRDIPGKQDEKPAATATSSPIKDFQFSSPIAIGSLEGQSPHTPHAYSREPIRTGGSGGNTPSPKKSVATSQTLFGLKAKPDLTAQPLGPLKASTEMKEGSVMDVLGKMNSRTGSGNLKMKQTAPSTESAGLKPAGELKAGSVMDILGKGTPLSTSDGKPNLADKFKAAPNSWDCPTSMMNNKESAETSVACETLKPPAASSAPAGTSVKVSVAASQALSTLFQPAAGTWEYPTSMIQEKPEMAKSPACDTAKPGAPPPASKCFAIAPGPSAKPSLSELFKPAAGSWECPTCMLQNHGTIDTCPACQMKKPGASSVGVLPDEKDTMAIPKPTGPGFGDKFKPAAGTWECYTCMVNNKPEATKCIACETPRPGAKPTTNFTSPGGFKFGGSVPPTATTSSSMTSVDSNSSGFKFGGSATSSTSGGKDTPGFKLSQPATDGKTSFGGIFSQRQTEETSDSNKSDTKAGGFHFPVTSASSDSKTNTKPAGFSFPAAAASPDANNDTRPDELSFSASSDSKSDTKPDGFSFSTPKGDTKLGGFSFAGTASDSKSNPKAAGFGSACPTASSMASNPKPGGFNLLGSSGSAATSSTRGGFSFSDSLSKDTGMKSPDMNTDRKPADSDQKNEKPGGFNFGSSLSVPVTSKSTDLGTSKPVVESSSGIFGSLGTTPASTASPFGVGDTTPKEATVGGVEKPVAANMGLFSFGQKPELKTDTVTSTGAALGTTGTGGSLGGFASPTATPSLGARPANSGSMGLGAFAAKPAETSTAASNPLFAFSGKPAEVTTAGSSATSALAPQFTFSAKPASSSNKRPLGAEVALGVADGTASRGSEEAPPKKGKADFGGFAPSASTGPAFASSQTTASGPSFGTSAPPLGSTAKLTGSTLTFGSTLTTPAPFATTSTSSLNFGSTNTTAAAVPAPAFGSGLGSGTAATSSNPAPLFASAALAPTFGSTTTTTSSAPAFGAATSGFGTFGSSAPFGSAPATTSSASNSGGFNFPTGASVASPFGSSTTTTTASTGFNFAVAAQSTGSIFQFGAAASQTAATPAQQQPAPSFHFSAGSQEQTVVPQAASRPFTFSAQPQQPTTSNPFNNAQGAQSGKRVVKRAVRKLGGRKLQ